MTAPRYTKRRLGETSDALMMKVASPEQQRLASVAAGCFAEDGFVATTVNKICTRAGISNGSLYHHFKHRKSEIAIAAYNHMIKEFLAALGPVDAHLAAPREQRLINGLLEPYAKWLVEDRPKAEFILECEAMLAGHLSHYAVSEARDALKDRVWALYWGTETDKRIKDLTQMQSKALIEAVLLSSLVTMTRDWLRMAGEGDRANLPLSQLAACVSTFASDRTTPRRRNTRTSLSR